MTISKRLAEKLGGDVELIDTKPGVGSRFRLTVPAGPLEHVRMLERPTEAATTKPRQPNRDRVEAASLLGCPILVAEDGPDNQRLIAHVLQKAGAEVTIVGNGRLAVDACMASRDAESESASGCPFDVILMDMQMPVMDGYTATTLLRQKGYTGPIIALTAHAMADDRQKCLDAGCDGYASKPIDRRRLIETIASHVDAYRRTEVGC